MQLTENFTLEEFTDSETARRMKIPNLPSLEAYANIKALCRYLLQPLRDDFGKPIRISSGYRSPALNAYVGGNSKSQHLTGQAADIVVKRKEMQQLFHLVATRHMFDQLIVEIRRNALGHVSSCWLHVSFRLLPEGNRQQILLCTKPGEYKRISSSFKF